MNPAGPQELEAYHLRSLTQRSKELQAVSVISKRTGLAVLLWTMDARSFT